MTYDLPGEEEAFDRLVKRILTEEWERFPAPGVRVWRALAVRLGPQAKGTNKGVAQSLEYAQGSNDSDGQDNGSGSGSGATPCHWDC